MAKKTLYISRPVTNAQAVIDWAKSVGFDTVLTPEDLHVTIAYSKAEVDWGAVSAGPDTLLVRGGDRALKRLGKEGEAVVLRIESDDLARRWQEVKDVGGSWDWPSYQPHITLSYNAADLDIEAVTPFEGVIELGAEVFAEVDSDWEAKEKAQKSYDPSRWPNYKCEPQCRAHESLIDIIDAFKAKHRHGKVMVGMKSDGSGESRVHEVRIKSVDAAKQIVYGEVYAPDVLDTHTEFMGAEDIEVMAHRFMQVDLTKAIDVQHDNVAVNAHPVESFIARAGDPDYTPGAWVLGVKIVDPYLWARVQSGELNGFSFQSRVRMVETEVEYEVLRDHVGKTEMRDDHSHTYFVQLDATGAVIGGSTSAAADGHVHQIKKASVTDRAGSDLHSHRFFL